MKNYRGIVSGLASALLVEGYFIVPTLTRAAIAGDSPEVKQLLADARAEAVELKNDSENMESFTKSQLSWGSYAHQVSMIKEHVNKTGTVLTKLQNAKAGASPWQQMAIERIEPLLKELAANTETTINYLKENRDKVHFTEFGDYVKANYELATDLESLIRDFVDYGNAKEKFENLGERLEVTR